MTPTKTGGHLLLAVMPSGHMELAAIVEERDLVAYFRHEYESYRQHVPVFLPKLKPIPVENLRDVVECKRLAGGLPPIVHIHGSVVLAE